MLRQRSDQLDDDVVQRACRIGDTVSGIGEVAIGFAALEHVQIVITLEERGNRSPIRFFNRTFGFPGGVGIDAGTGRISRQTPKTFGQRVGAFTDVQLSLIHI